MSRPEDDVPTDADFGIHEGEVDELERRWATRAEEQEENNRLVIQEEFEIEVDGGPAAEAPMRWTGLRRRRRRVTALDRALFNACPVFYGWMVAALVAATALFISPAQVYCVGAVLDAIQAQLRIDRERVSLLYGLSMLMAAPFIVLEGRVVAFVSRRLLAALCALLFCTGCMLLSSVREAGPQGGGSQLGLLLLWTLLQVAGPGMLYPLVHMQLQQWWRQKLGRVQMAAESAACVLGMVLMPAIVSAAAGCPAGTPRPSGAPLDGEARDCRSDAQAYPAHDMQAHLASECWGALYWRLGGALLLPMLLLALLLLEGGAAELGVGLDASATVALNEEGGQQPPSPHAAAHADAPSPPLTPTGTAADAPAEAMVRARPASPTARWRLDEALGHTSFWLAQVSISLVHAVIAAFLFHRHDLLADLHAQAAMPMPPETGLHVQLLTGALAAVSTPAGALRRHKEGLVLLALVLTAAGLLLLVHQPTHTGLLGASGLLGAALGVTNAYSTKLWQHFYGMTDEQRIRYTSIAITTAASGLGVYLFALSRKEMCHYRAVMNTCAVLALVLAGLDLLALAPPGLIEAMVQRAPTWEQMLARRQHAGYFSISGQVHRLLRAIDSLARPARQATNSARREAATPNRTMANPMERANPIVNVIPVERVFSANSSATPEKC